MAESYQSLFIQGLSQIEIHLVEEQLKRSKRRNESKEIKLLKTLTSNPNKVYSDNELKAFTGTTSGSLRLLKKRVFDKAAEALIQDVYINAVQQFDECDRIALKLRKKFVLCGVLQLTPRNYSFQIQLEIINQIIAIAKEYELFGIVLDALRRKTQIMGFRKGQQEFDKVNNQLKFYTNCYNAINFASDCYCKVSINESRISMPSGKLTIFIKNSIAQLKNDYTKTKSLQIKHYLLILQFAYAEQKKDYTAAIKLSKRYGELIKNNKAIYRKSRMATAHINLSLYYLLTEKYTLARTHCSIGKKFMIKGSFEYSRAIEHEFFIEFYERKYEVALNLSNVLVTFPVSDEGPFLKSKHEFFRAWVYFGRGSFRTTLSLLNQSFELEKDKTLWNIGLKILLIQTYIELNKFDEASRAIESLRKHVERHNKGGKIKKRDLLIIKTLREYEKEGFNYTLENKTIPKLLNTLAQKNKPISWEHKTPEMIPFHEWLENR